MKIIVRVKLSEAEKQAGFVVDTPDGEVTLSASKSSVTFDVEPGAGSLAFDGKKSKPANEKKHKKQ
jgi:hypothetical protein